MTGIPVIIFMVLEDENGTVIWATEKVIDLLTSGKVIRDATQRKLVFRWVKGMSDAGFNAYIPNIVKRKQGKTFGVHVGQYRIVGFFDSHAFIMIDWFQKQKQRNDKLMTAIYEKVDAIRETGAWTKIN